MDPQSMRDSPIMAAATKADVGSFKTIAVLEDLLIQSIRLRNLHKSARWQIRGSQFDEIRKILDDHYKEQLSLIGLLVDRIRTLGGAARVFASDFLQSTQFCRVLRDPRALNQLLRDLLEAHESVVSAAGPHNSNEDQHWVRDFAVGQVVHANEQQCEAINGKLLSNRPQQRIHETDTGRLHERE
jgi:starvation-inducible DNA-binding protein